MQNTTSPGPLTEVGIPTEAEQAAARLLLPLVRRKKARNAELLESFQATLTYIGVDTAATVTLIAMYAKDQRDADGAIYILEHIAGGLL